MATRKKTAARKTSNASRGAGKSAARKKAPARGGSTTASPAKRTTRKKTTKAAGREKGAKTRAQALAEAREKIVRKKETPRLTRLKEALPHFSEMYHQVIQAYAAASREMAERLAAARRGDKPVEEKDQEDTED